MNDTSPVKTARDKTARDKTARKPRVAVVFGGRSSEHGISCVTAGSVLSAIDREAYDVVPVGIAPTAGGSSRATSPPGWRSTAATCHRSTPGGPRWRGCRCCRQAPDLVVAEPATVSSVIGGSTWSPLLHGPWGEDGTLEGRMLRLAGVRYVGSGVLASAIGMDKAYMKVVLQAAGLPVTPGIVVTRTEHAQDAIGVRTRIEELGFPCFAKPARAGSSMGISKVHDASEIDAALEEAFRHDPKVLVEQSMEGAREVECGVLEHARGPAGDVATGRGAHRRRARVLRLRGEVPRRPAHRDRHPRRPARLGSSSRSGRWPCVPSRPCRARASRASTSS